MCAVRLQEIPMVPRSGLTRERSLGACPLIRGRDLHDFRLEELLELLELLSVSYLYFKEMAATSRGLRSSFLRQDFVCSRCLFSTTSSVQSGHNRWSKIKHDKGAVDAKKNVQRSVFSREIALASKRTSTTASKSCLTDINSVRI